MDIKHLNGKYIGYPCTPSKWTDFEKLEATVITMSCGGGMGGSKWYEYVLRTNDKPEGIQKYLTIENKEIRLNSNYIVKMENYTVVTAHYETTNRNFTDSVLKRSISFLVDDDVKVELLDEYADDAKRLNRELERSKKYY